MAFVPLSTRSPLTVTRSFMPAPMVGALVRFQFKKAPRSRTRLLAKVRVPAALKPLGETVELDCAVKLPTMKPLLPTMDLASPRANPPAPVTSNTALLFTEICAELEMEPVTARARTPPLMTVLPVWVLRPLSVWVPAPALVNARVLLPLVRMPPKFPLPPDAPTVSVAGAAAGEKPCTQPTPVSASIDSALTLMLNHAASPTLTLEVSGMVLSAALPAPIWKAPLTTLRLPTKLFVFAAVKTTRFGPRMLMLPVPVICPLNVVRSVLVPTRLTSRFRVTVLLNCGFAAAPNVLPIFTVPPAAALTTMGRGKPKPVVWPSSRSSTSAEPVFASPRRTVLFEPSELLL